MAELEELQQARVDAKLAEIKRAYGDEIGRLLKEINQVRLKGTGEIKPMPVIENNCLRWTLTWTEQQKISFELNIVVNVEDDGRVAKVGRVWVRRHASTEIDFDGHTPTTRMRRLATLSMDGIREAIDAEWT